MSFEEKKRKNPVNKSDQDIWEALDQAVFGASDEGGIRKKLTRGMQEWERLESSLGGFLFLLRERKGLTVPEIASKAKVSETVWEMWEGDVAVPTGAELGKLSKNLGLYQATTEKLLELWHRAPFQSLCRVAQFRPQLLAARGVAALDAKSQWELLHPEAQDRLALWGEKRGFVLPEQLFELLKTLEFESDEDQQAWARDVWNERS